MSTPEDALRAATAFGLEGARVIEAFAASTQNDNWLVENDEAGRVVLRRCVRNANFDRQRWQRELEAHLARRGFPVAPLLLAVDGNAVVELEGDLWTASEFVPGSEYDYANVRHAEDAGRRLAEFHLATAGLAIDSRASTPLAYAPRAHYILGAAAELAAFRRRLPAAEFEGDIADLESWLRPLLPRWPVERFDALPGGLIHGDYHGRNLIFDGDAVAALLDFDMVEPGPFVLDIVRAIPAFARTGRGSYELRVHVGRAFLMAYESVRPLKDDERAAIPDAALLWSAPLDVFYDLHPQARLDPLKTARSDFAHWRASVGQQGALEEVVARA